MSEKFKDYKIVYLWSPGYGTTFSGGLFSGDNYRGTKPFNEDKVKALGIKILHGKERTKFLSRLGYVVDSETKRLRFNKNKRFER